MKINERYIPRCWKPVCDKLAGENPDQVLRCATRRVGDEDVNAMDCMDRYRFVSERSAGKMRPHKHPPRDGNLPRISEGISRVHTRPKPRQS